MPRYFFHVRDGTDLPDEEGTVLADLPSAKVEAVRLAGALLLDEAEKFWEGSEWKLSVADERGTQLFQLNFTATDTSPPP